MRIKFLGTGASEAIPAMFCKCRICENARMVGGKEMRSRTGLLVDEALMIDFSPDAYWHARNYGLDLKKVKSLIVTHGHSDHFNYEDLTNNRDHAVQGFEPDYGYPSPLKLYANDAVLELAKKGCQGNSTQGSIEYHQNEYWTTFETEGYKITPLPAQHMQLQKSMTYLIEKDGKSYLHLCDTGELKVEVFEYLKEKGVKVDISVIDSTFGLLSEEYFGHLNFNQVLRMCEKFKSYGIFDEKTKVYLTHISHSGNCTHEEIESVAAKYGINVAYDGLNIDL